MFNDILGNKKDKSIPCPETNEEIIKAMEYNIKEKQKIIEDLVKKITELENTIENL